VFSDQRLHILQLCDTGWEYRAFHHLAYAKYSVSVSDNAVREFRNPCRDYQNVGLMIWAITQYTWQKKQWLTKQIVEK